ncbi:unnamed protein product [Mytilus edulis]|uniref:B box-type domain-containing protein n=1 Tax=Mytilus edulis TaxID=6550 RepID=A0A8S3V8B7_MYTED|nr:unnamed protein product [Mytilus edulis]
MVHGCSKDIASQKQEAKVNTDFSALKEEKAARKHSREPVNTYVKGLHQSIPGKIGEVQCGQLIESDDDYAHEQYGAKVIEQYQTGLKLVEQLVCSDDGTLWIGNIADKILQKTQLSNGKLNIVQEVKKVKSNDQHTIINIKDIARQQAKDDIPCEIHSGQNCGLFCQTCDEVVCPLCIANTHRKHHMIGLAEGYNLTIKKIKTFSSELVMKLSNYEKGRSTLSSFKSSEEFKYKIEKQIILSREKVLKDEVEMHTKNLLKELDQRWDLLKQSVNDVDNTTQKINKDLEFRTESLTNALASVKSCDVFQAYKEERAARKQNIEPVKARFKRLPKYVPGKLQIQQAFHGELQESDDDYEYALDQFELKVIKQYKTELKSIAQIVCCDDETLWIRDINKKYRKYNFQIDWYILFSSYSLQHLAWHYHYKETYFFLLQNLI